VGPAPRYNRRVASTARADFSGRAAWITGGGRRTTPRAVGY